ncbi:MAG: C-methyltransferase [Candidatus Gottesmanbacteria bacterium GW2011_GWA1_34_13]|uniref:C-methyltransferase n=1 Tax=Candidatus Gottesmanbacteria bacterium GW2011_GWA1_34_13 TaxID=1618434 RepID=A0A0G0DXU4_9BACT|nr:MAG: C-methyltransferase [Candidatus Gottesmanbacteria bacterium GW2011_GWA1_34_13]
MIKKITKCRICNSRKITKFFAFGSIPLPNGFLTKEQLKKSEKFYPLTAGYCNICGLVQLTEIVNPEEMFKNYVYIPSSSKTRMNNFETIALQAQKKFKLKSNSLIIDIGSNDGSMLSYFKGLGYRTLGIDPAENLAKIAVLKGIETINDYISIKLSKKIKSKYGSADIITATNVVAHISDLPDLLLSVEQLLSDNGVFICEFPYLLDLIRKNQFDTIYHEHLSYFSIKPLIYLIKRSNLKLIDVQRTSIDGGSLRIFLAKKSSVYKINNQINKLFQQEIKVGLYDAKTYIKFAKNVKQLCKLLKKTLKKLKIQGKTIAGYGAAAKGNILLNYSKIDNKLIDFIVDSTSYKQGLYTPGTHIPIYPEIEIINRQPDYVLILAWNFVKEIINKQVKYSKNGGKFIIPVPKIKII